MDPYQAMYVRLLNKMTDIIEEIEAVQKQTEEMYLSAEDENIGGGLCAAPKRSSNHGHLYPHNRTTTL